MDALSLMEKQLSNGSCRIAVDLMGCDRDSTELSQAIPLILETLPDSVHLIVFSSPAAAPFLLSLDRVTVVTPTEVIGMEEDPLKAIRSKKDSSICIGIELLRDGKIDAFVSAGNTGALIGAAKTKLPTLPGIARPALLALLPTESHPIAVLDVGANATVKASHLVQFAKMGLAYQKCRGIENPTCGLLNIGSEPAKGSPLSKEAYTELLELNGEREVFIGNVEGKTAWQGHFDVLVTDGFTGNVFLKTAEGLSSFILSQMIEIGTKNCSGDLKLLLSDLQHRLHYSEYPGALLCGVEGIVVKCHGDATAETLLNTVKGTYRLLNHGYLDKLRAELS